MRLLRVPVSGQYQILSICDARGKSYLYEFFHALGANLEGDADRMLALLERVAAVGPPRNTDISHQIDGDIYEFIQGRLRVLWFYDAGRVVVCCQGFVKKSRKTPATEIERARRLRSEYQMAKDSGQLNIEEEDDG
jgi:phage-related protein